MNTTEKHDRPRGQAVRLTADHLEVELRDGRSIRTPLAWYPRLHGATPGQLAAWRWIGDGTGLRWPDLDEDLSVQGMLNGSPAVAARPVTAHA